MSTPEPQIPPPTWREILATQSHTLLILIGLLAGFGVYAAIDLAGHDPGRIIDLLLILGGALAGVAGTKAV